MGPLETVGAVATISALVIGATWALRAKLDEIVTAVRVHVAQDEATHKDHTARIISLETARKAPRGRR